MVSASRSSADTTELRWSGYAPELLAAYLEFAAREFGRHAYQANPTYPAWLYAENPCGAKADKDFLLGVGEGGRVVACAHKLRLSWRMADGSHADTPALHNIMAAPEHRQGIGAMLLLAAVARDQHVLVPGVAAYLSAAYKKLGSQPIEARWYRWILNPAAGAAHIAGGKLGRAAPRWRVERLRWIALMQRIFPGIDVDRAPSDARCREVAEALVAPHAGAATPAWTGEVVRWRFFHPIGPRHLLVTREGGRFLAIVALGRMRGARVARAVELRAEDAGAMRRGITALRALLFWLGGDFMLAFSADARQNGLLAEAGAPRIAGVDTWIYHRRRAAVFPGYGFAGGAGDFGFEAL